MANTARLRLREICDFTISQIKSERLLNLLKVRSETKGLSVFFASLCVIDLFGVFPIVALPSALISCGKEMRFRIRQPFETNYKKWVDRLVLQVIMAFRCSCSSLLCKYTRPWCWADVGWLPRKSTRALCTKIGETDWLISECKEKRLLMDFWCFQVSLRCRGRLDIWETYANFRHYFTGFNGVRRGHSKYSSR